MQMEQVKIVSFHSYDLQYIVFDSAFTFDFITWFHNSIRNYLLQNVTNSFFEH